MPHFVALLEDVQAARVCQERLAVHFENGVFVLLLLPRVVFFVDELVRVAERLYLDGGLLLEG